ncbi:hypothetical protein [Polaromonas sp.]|uniref:hypothetical protein n=1 Tax=Polaromonas sp. TaxID=1869339 RepID=UPI0013BD5F23|nr:hypothetical protein [Polaromonas sp.]NDP63071.1 hypothetical protein [Polaromonas sp.]
MTDEKFLRQELEQEACDAFDRSQSTIEMNKEIHFSIEKCLERITIFDEFARVFEFGEETEFGISNEVVLYTLKATLAFGDEGMEILLDHASRWRSFPTEFAKRLTGIVESLHAAYEVEKMMNELPTKSKICV